MTIQLTAKIHDVTIDVTDKI